MWKVLQIEVPGIINRFIQSRKWDFCTRGDNWIKLTYEEWKEINLSMDNVSQREEYMQKSNNRREP